MWAKKSTQIEQPWRVQLEKGSGFRVRLRFLRSISRGRIGSEGIADAACLEGRGDLVSRLRTPITYIVTLLNLLTKSP